MYITTTLPYLNNKPHIGHSLEFVQADVRVRFERLMGNEVFFNIGSDEYGVKIYQKAKEENMEPKEYVDKMVKYFTDLLDQLNIHPTRFIRTTDKDHKESVHYMWNKCLENGDIYKGKHSGNYCVGCELYKKESDLINGECPEHLGKKLEYVEEENYFFRLSKYKERLLELFNEKDFIIPESKKEEIKSFVSKGLDDLSISRQKDRLPWGIEVPNDDSQVIYVWFDALTNYLTTIGWPHNNNWKKFWPVIQLAGKDNLRQQSVYWQSMLMSAGVEPSKQIYIHSFINIKGQKMSKTIGNVINPIDIIDKYGSEFLRLFLLKHINPYEDFDIDWDFIDSAYEADMVKGIGNLVSRIITMSEFNNVEIDIKNFKEDGFDSSFIEFMRQFNYKKAVEIIFNKISGLDKRITVKEPFKLIKNNREEGEKEIQLLMKDLFYIAKHLEPIMPITSETIINGIKNNKTPAPLFSRV